MKSFNPLVILAVFGLTLGAALLTGPEAWAASDSHRAAAGRLMDTMELDTLMAGSIESMLRLEISQNPTLQPFEQTMRAFFTKYMSGESLREGFINIYVETFTERELDEINAFYATPTGKKTLNETPVLLEKGARLGQQRIQENIPELQRMIQEEAQRIKSMQQNTQ